MLSLKAPIYARGRPNLAVGDYSLHNLNNEPETMK